MPPAVSDSEPDSNHEEIIPGKKSVGRKKTPVKDPVSEDEEVDANNEEEGHGGDGEVEDEEEEVYQVEEILNHDLEVPGEIRYEVKWLGYDNPADRTWESEENLQGAKEILQAYFEKIGGRPEKPGKTKKRGRKSVGKADTPDKPAKKIKSDEEPPKKKDGRGRKRKSELNDTVEMMDIETTQRDGWEPPKALPGAWEEGVISVHTIEGTDDGTKWAYLMWADEGEDGKKRQTKAKLSTCYVACPQMMLKFFESHLVFTDKASNDKGKKTNGN